MCLGHRFSIGALSGRDAMFVQMPFVLMARALVILCMNSYQLAFVCKWLLRTGLKKNKRSAIAIVRCTNVLLEFSGNLNCKWEKFWKI